VATHDLERRLMRRMVDGLAGWATYQQALGAKQLYNEHFFINPYMISPPGAIGKFEAN
jgi:hypothetical protein